MHYDGNGFLTQVLEFVLSILENDFIQEAVDQGLASMTYKDTKEMVKVGAVRATSIDVVQIAKRYQ